MNAQTHINLCNAFAASGMIRAEHNALERHRRELLLAPLEEALAEAWRAERFADGHTHVTQEVSAFLAAQRKEASDRAAAANRAKRQARKTTILGYLRQAPMQRADLQGLVALSEAATKKLLCEMVNEGLIVMTPIAGRRRQFVYEVAQ